MSYYCNRLLAKGEHPIYICGVHWIYLISGFMWFLAFSGIGLFLDIQQAQYFGDKKPEMYDIPYLDVIYSYPLALMFFIAAGSVFFFHHLLEYHSTEVALTSQRLILKQGWIFVDVIEIDLPEIRSEKVRHGLLGSALNYGRIDFESRFVGDIGIPAIKHPHELLKHIHEESHRIHDPLTE